MNDNIHNNHQYEAIDEQENEVTEEMQQSEIPETQELEENEIYDQQDTEVQEEEYAASKSDGLASPPKVEEMMILDQAQANLNAFQNRY